MIGKGGGGGGQNIKGLDIKRRMNNNNYYHICFPAKTHEEVIWFNVSMQKSFSMHILYSRNLHFSEWNKIKSITYLLI